MHLKINQTDSKLILQVLMEFFFQKGAVCFLLHPFCFQLGLPKEIKTMFRLPRRAKEESYGLQKRCKETLRLSAYRTVFYHIYVFVKF